MSELTTTDIDDVLSNHANTRIPFIGVFAHDQLPTKLICKKKWVLVCNASPIESPGTHWFALFKECDDVMELFDSIGGDPASYNLVEFMQNQQVEKCIYNSVRIQSLFSNVCGHYAIYFAIHRCIGMSMEKIAAMFSDINFIENDDYVNSFYKNLIID